jgi:hypothetical protein
VRYLRTVRSRLGIARAVLLALALVGALVGPARSEEELPSIHPGDLALIGPYACTYGFAFDGVGPRAGRVYLLIAGHCVVDNDGSLLTEVAIESGEVIADVVAVGNPDYTADDWALLEVRASAVSRIRGEVRGLPGYPLGYTAASETQALDGIRVTGWGIPFFVTSATREGRWGTMGVDDSGQYTVTAPIFKGDSGGPIVHAPTGKAVGIVSRICAGTCTTAGPSIEGIVARAASVGFPLALRLTGS